MLYILTAAWVLVHACLAATTPWKCNFGMSAEGAVDHNINLLETGQARGSQHATKMTFTMQGGSLFDDQGRGCYWAQPSTVLVCNIMQRDQAPTGWNTDCSRHLLWEGQDSFSVCWTGIGDETNFYLKAPSPACAKVQIKTDNINCPCALTPLA